MYIYPYSIYVCNDAHIYITTIHIRENRIINIKFNSAHAAS